MCLTLVLVACSDDGGGNADDEVGGAAVDTESGSGDSGSETESGTPADATATETAAESTADTTATDTTAADTTTTDESTTDETTTDESMNHETAFDPNMACQEFSSDVAPVPPNVMFLLDRSGSMLHTSFDPLDPQKTRWQALYESVEAVVDGGADATIAFGVKMFSTEGLGGCSVSQEPEVPIKLENAALLLATIPGPKAQVNGGTPINLGLEMSMTYMQQYEGSGGPKFLFLITDGSIACTNDLEQSLADAVTLLEDASLKHGITTYVIGIAPSIFGATQLDAMAVAGGAPKMGLGGEDFYRADDAQQLSNVLAEVVADSYSCLIDLAEAPFFPDLTKVVIDGQSFDLVDDCDLQDGFVYVDDMNSQIELCGAACKLLGVVQEAEVQYYCDPG